MKHGDDFLLENPLASDARKQPVIQKLEKDSRTCSTVSHMCCFDLRHPKTGQWLKKPTWWLSNSPEIIA
eukprot:10575611-Lingulodinium_polyedra.AAC.1